MEAGKAKIKSIKNIKAMQMKEKKKDFPERHRLKAKDKVGGSGIVVVDKMNCKWP